MPNARSAVHYLNNAIGLLPSETMNDAYYRDEQNYILGLIHAFSGEHQEAGEAFFASQVLPYSGGHKLFDTAVRESLEIAAAQDDAIARKIPPILISCMPRAASAALTQTLSAALDAPLMRISAGDFADYGLVNCWTARFLRGGAVLHDHFGASDHNLSVLADHGVRRVPVLVRDPRAAAVSFARLSGSTRERLVFSAYHNRYLPWLSEWLNQDKVEVVWIKSSDATTGADGLAAAIRTVLDTNGADIQTPPEHLVQANFVEGKPDGWRQHISSRMQRKMWDICPGDIKGLLDMQP